ncbi:hypothetical protein CPC08DRAFT_716765 [Agrocybe pediades]|nr:hypothetical protein CPC08DRAFT_716765 [Agrocybe pediades]
MVYLGNKRSGHHSPTYGDSAYNRPPTDHPTSHYPTSSHASTGSTRISFLVSQTAQRTLPSGILL